MSSKVAKAILLLRPDAEFVVRGTLDNYEIEWHSNDISKPSDSEIQEGLTALELLAYKDKRAEEYPSFADQFDIIFHEGIDAWKAQIQAIKDKYPKAGE